MSTRIADVTRALPPIGLPRPARIGPFAVTAGAVAVAALVGLGLAGVSGATPGLAIQALWDGIAGTGYAVGSGLNRAALLLLVGTGFAVAQRAGLTNVGGEGQICVGALVATAFGTGAAHHLPTLLAIPATLATGALGGAAWAGIAGWLRVARGTSEVITSLLLNFVGLGLVSLAVHETALLRQPVTSAATLPQSTPLAASSHLPLVAGTASPATLAVVVALAVAVLAFLALGRTPTGLRMRAVAASEPAAARQGLRVGRLLMGAMLTSGAMSGVVGAILVTTAPYVLAEGVSAGLGFAGLVVGLLGRGRAVGTLVAAFGLGFLATGGVNLQLAAQVPSAVVVVMQSVVVLLIAGSVRWSQRSRS